jgi:hypothetical protein
MAGSSLDNAELPVRPGDFARMLLAASDAPARARARDQQADRLGDALKRRVLNRLIVLDPEPDSLEAALLTIVADLNEPAGSTRAVCTTILQEWEMARLSPALLPFLIEQAMQNESAVARSKTHHGPETP